MPPNCDDNCPEDQNSAQTNSPPLDPFGNACDQCPDIADFLEDSTHRQLDTDGDEIPDACDNCPDSQNIDQMNSDTDIHGDGCDNCRLRSNTNQDDTDGDDIGDACDMATPGLPGGTTDNDGDDMPLYIEQLAGTSDADVDSDGDGFTDWGEWTILGTDPTEADTDGDGIRDDVELAQGSNPLDPDSGVGLCGDVNRDASVDIVDVALVRRKLAGSTVPSSYTPNRCDYVSAGACTAADVSELRAYLASPNGSPMANTCPGVPHDTTTVLYTMDGQASIFSPAAQTLLANESYLKVEGSGSLGGAALSASADAAFSDSFSATDWTGDRLRFSMLVPDTTYFGANDGFRVIISSSSTSAGSNNRIWYFGKNDVPQGIWKEYEIDPTVGWDEAHNTFNITAVRRLRIEWNKNDGAGRVIGETIYLDAFKRFDPAFP